jgi:hypothetical protein
MGRKAKPTEGPDSEYEDDHEELTSPTGTEQSSEEFEVEEPNLKRSKRLADRRSAAPVSNKRVSRKRQPATSSKAVKMTITLTLSRVDKVLASVAGSPAVFREQEYAKLVRAYLCRLLCK